MIDMDAIRSGIADGSLALVPAPPSAEFEEMRAWHDWLLLSAAMCIRVAWAFGVIAAWRQWRQMMMLAVEHAVHREAMLAYMFQWQTLSLSPPMLVKAVAP